MGDLKKIIAKEIKRTGDGMDYEIETIEVSISKKKDYFMVYIGTENSSGVKEKCYNTNEIGEVVKNYVENMIMDANI